MSGVGPRAGRRGGLEKGRAVWHTVTVEVRLGGMIWSYGRSGSARCCNSRKSLSVQPPNGETGALHHDGAWVRRRLAPQACWSEVGSAVVVLVDAAVKATVRAAPISA